MSYKYRIIYFYNNHDFFLDNTKVSDKDDNLKVEEPKNVVEENVETKLCKNTMKCNVVDEKCEFKSKKSVSII